MFLVMLESVVGTALVLVSATAVVVIAMHQSFDVSRMIDVTGDEVVS